MVLCLGSAVVQFYQSKQLLVTGKNTRKLRDILRSASSGQQADQSEISAAVNNTTKYFIPIMVFIVTIRLASALSLYWFVGGLVAFIQQSFVLREDESELESLADGTVPKDLAKIPEAELVDNGSQVPSPSPQNKKQSRKKRRRR